MTPSSETPRLVTGYAGEGSARAAPLKSESPMPQTQDQARSVESLASEMKAAAEAVERYLAQLDLSRGIDKETIHGFHVGTDREAELKSSDLRTLLASHTAQAEEIERLREAPSEVAQIVAKLGADGVLDASNTVIEALNAQVSTLSAKLVESEARAEITEAMVERAGEAFYRVQSYPHKDRMDPVRAALAAALTPQGERK